MELGAKCRDRVSGFVGVAVACHTYLNGCARFTLQPSVDKDGKLPETQTFDGMQLEIISPNVHESKTDTGGPEKYSDNRGY